MKVYFRLILLVLVSFIGLDAYADISEASFAPHGRVAYPVTDESEVEVYIMKPDFKFRVIGRIEARGMAEANSSISGQIDSAVGQIFGRRSSQPGEKEDIALAMRALVKEAAQNGAHGVIIIQSVQVRVSENATERRIIAAAIRQE